MKKGKNNKKHNMQTAETWWWAENDRRFRWGNGAWVMCWQQSRSEGESRRLVNVGWEKYTWHCDSLELPQHLWGQVFNTCAHTHMCTHIHTNTHTKRPYSDAVIFNRALTPVLTVTRSWLKKLTLIYPPLSC